MILSIDIFYFKTVIIGGPINVLESSKTKPKHNSLMGN